ncbi:protein of unknown function [Magnetospirillum sp. XM-1]|nr:protein of unknown function [Magnetospirillum sp. XM-1]
MPQRLEFREETSKKAGKGSEDRPLLHCNIYRWSQGEASQNLGENPQKPAESRLFPHWWTQYRYDHFVAGIMEILA